MPPSVTISIVNHRTFDLALGYPRFVLAVLSWIYEQVIVENASSDGSAQEIAAWIDAQVANLPVKSVHSETNSEFAGGHNKGMADPPVGRCLVLNSNAVLRLGFLKTTLEAAQANRDAGLSAGFPHDYPILYGLFLSHPAFDLHFPFVQK